MIQSASNFHVAIIMDGNGRWATQRGLARSEGHRAGAEAIRRVVRAAPLLGVRILTLYAFSGSNWGRPASEVMELMRLFECFFRAERAEWHAQGVSARAVGRRDRLPTRLLKAIEEAEEATRGGDRLRLRFAIDYSGQDVIVEAARRLQEVRVPDREAFSRLLAEAAHSSLEDATVDLLVRTGGEHRLSDFLLWELAYTELYFTSCLWPDFAVKDLEAALADFRSRERRYGRVPEHIAV